MEESSNIALFLKETKLKIGKLLDSDSIPKSTLLHIVIGNESADLDSVVSSIVYAYHLQTKVQDQNIICIPIINIPEEDFSLKTEVNAVFQKLDLHLSDNLLFREELLNLSNIHLNLDVVLVDHNVLPSYLYFLHPRVTAIIDHHQDGGTFEDPYVSKTIEPVGSCCTLIAENIYNQSETLFKEYPITELLLSAILLDTVNLNSQSGRVTEKDVEFAEELETISRIPGKELFDIAQNAKFNMSTLCCKDMLRKDFKTVPCSSGIQHKTGVSSITLSLATYLERETWQEDTASFTSASNLELIILMFIHKEADITKREILAYSVNPELLNSMSEFLLRMSDLQLTPFESDASVPCVRMFHQGHVPTSRKVLMPKLSKFFNEMGVSFYGEPLGKVETVLVNGEHDSSIHEDNSRTDYLDADANANYCDASLESPCIVNGDRIGKTEELSVGDSPTSGSTFTDLCGGRVHDEALISPVCTSETTQNGKEQVCERFAFSRENAVLSQEDAKFSQDIAAVSRGESSYSWKDSLLSQEDSFLSRGGSLLARKNAPFSQDGTSTSRKRTPLSRESTTSSGEDKSFPRAESLYSHDEIEKSLDQPTLEFEYDWNSELYDIKSSKKHSTSSEKKHKIMIRDLSFDESNTLPDLVGMDLLCPVFLAVTEDDEDDDVVLKDIRRKTKSIENLCSIIPSEEDEFPLRRTKSELPMTRRKSPMHTKIGKRDSDKRMNFATRHDSIQEEATYDENPFAGDREFSDEEIEDNVEDSSEAELSTSRDSADFRAEMKSTSSFSDPLRSTEKTIERFSFSDESLEMYETHEYDCECNQCRKANISDDVSIPEHVPGLWDRFVTVNVGNSLRVVDLKLIEPYMKVIAHGGIHEVGDERRVIMVFTAAYLPPKFIPKYKIVMEQLFYYVVHTLDLSVGDNYDIIYFNNSGPNMPSRDWLKKCYNMITRRLRKNLQSLYLVHPDFWLKAMVRFYRPFISSKFFKKIHFVKTLSNLSRHVSLEYIFLPDEVKKADPESVFWLRN